ncbi:MAG: RNA polymerase sigma factor [Myxococcota bacterium]
MERYADGDDAAFGALYDALAPRLATVLRRRVKDPELVAEVMQHTFLQIHRARASYIRGASVFPWAFTIARRLVLSEFRKRKRQIETAGDDQLVLAAVAPEATLPDRRAEAREVIQVFEKALAAMPESQRVAFTLLKIDGLSLAEAAEVLGVSEMAVKLRAHRAYEALRAKYAELGETRPTSRST